MARPVTISDEQILAAARLVFVRDGVTATTRDIAREAGVSEGSLFKRFPTKEALFAAAIEFPDVPAWVSEMNSRLGKGELRENLLRVTLGMIQLLQERLPLVLVAWGSKPNTTEASDTAETPAIRDCRKLSEYLRQEVALGRLRPCNTEAAARMLFGACINFVMDRLTLKQPLPSEEVTCFAQGAVDALWQGLAPAQD